MTRQALERSAEAPLFPEPSVSKPKRKRAVDNRANNLSGSDWLKKSISIWNCQKNGEDRAVKHPAAFPLSLVAQLLDCFTAGSNMKVLDPFMGTGTTLAAACSRGHAAVGFEIYEEFIEAAHARLGGYQGQYEIIADDAARADSHLPEGSIDMTITSPPYWNILSRRRTADYKPAVPYGDDSTDLGNFQDYDGFLERFTEIMGSVARTMKPGGYAMVNVMDLRVKNRIYTLHSDVYLALEKVGYKLDDIIIWDRRADYNNLRPLGYPYKFRLNRVHEYILIFQREA